MDHILRDLNPQQQRAVTHSGSPLLLLAGAGSGKTRVLTHRAAYFVSANLANQSEVLLLTFTNKAAAEMLQRMKKLLPSGHTDQLFAGTFHSFCCRLLRKDGAAIGVSPNFVIYDENDQESLIRSAISDLGLTPKEFNPKGVAYFIESAKNNYQSPSDLKQSSHGFWQSYATQIYTKYQQKLEEYQALDFDDLLFKTVKLFLEYPTVLQKYQEAYKYILVDEYQDTNQIQYLLTKLLAQKYRQVTVVGDASQAIYSWRGADYRNLTSFTTDFKEATVINLEQNYRSTQTILTAANAVISKNTTHPVLKLFTTKKSDEKIRVIQADSELSEAELVAQKIIFLSQNLHISLRNIAVLYRMNAQSRVIEESFIKSSIPYVLIGGLRFYERAEVKDILAMLRFAVDQRDMVSYDRLEKTIGKKKLQNLQQAISGLNVSRFSSSQLLDALISASSYLDKFDPKDEEDQRRLENIKELKSVATSHPNVYQFLENVSLVQQEYSLQEKKKKKENKDGVRLMTLHSSKGLEFEVVFLVGFEEGILPHSRSMVEASDIEEERRLCYVGITRAKDFLYLTYAARRLYFGKSSLNEPSRFLSDIPEELVEIEQVASFRDYRRPAPAGDNFYYDPDIY